MCLVLFLQIAEWIMDFRDPCNRIAIDPTCDRDLRWGAGSQLRGVARLDAITRRQGAMHARGARLDREFPLLPETYRHIIGAGRGAGFRNVISVARLAVSPVESVKEPSFASGHDQHAIAVDINIG